MLNRNNIILALLSAASTQAMEIQKNYLCYPRSLGNITVKHDQEGFKVLDEVGESTVPPYKLPKALRNIKTEGLSNMLDAGAYLKINKDSKDQYGIDVDGRVRGGGPVLAYALYGLIKAVGIGVPSYVATRVAGKLIDQIPGSDTAKNIVGETVGTIADGAKSACMEVGALAGISLVPPGEGVVYGFGSAAQTLPAQAAYEAAMRNLGLGTEAAQAAAHAAYREASRQMIQQAATTASTVAVGKVATGVGLKALAGKTMAVGGGKFFVTFKAVTAGTAASTTSTLALAPGAGTLVTSGIAGNVIGAQVVNQVGLDTAAAAGGSAFVGSGTTIGGYVASVESAATAAFVWGMAQPTP